MVGNHERMITQFKAAMARLQVLGQPVEKMVDCSDVIPVPTVLNTQIEFPPTFTAADLQLACPELRIPNLATAPGPAISVAPV